MNTLIHILYRDAHNYKAIAGATVAGYDPALIDAIKATLDDEQFFIPEQVGLDRPVFDFGRGWDPDVDHPWCEIYFEPTQRTPTQGRTLGQLTAAFEAVEWDPFGTEAALRGLD